MTITSAKTSINKTKVPALFKAVDKQIGWEFMGFNLDIGGGKYDTATEFLADKMVSNSIYDPYNRPEKENSYALNFNAYDSVTISNVLNVIESDAHILDMLHLAKTRLIEGGDIYISVYEGNRSGKFKYGKDSMQRNWKLKDYLPLIQKVFPNAHLMSGFIAARNI